MAKKKTDEELEEELFNDGFGDSAPTETGISNRAEKLSDIAGELAAQLEEGYSERPYKHLVLKLESGGENEYFVTVAHQSHGLMNYMVSVVLRIKGVVFAAYKNTSLAEPEIYVRTDGSRDIKSIVKETIKLMRTEWNGMKNAIAAIKS